jgi:hypothetical protein
VLNEISQIEAELKEIDSQGRALFAEADKLGVQRVRDLNNTNLSLSFCSPAFFGIHN